MYNIPSYVINTSSLCIPTSRVISPSTTYHPLAAVPIKNISIIFKYELESAKTVVVVIHFPSGLFTVALLRITRA